MYPCIHGYMYARIHVHIHVAVDLYTAHPFIRTAVDPTFYTNVHTLATLMTFCAQTYRDRRLTTRASSMIDITLVAGSHRQVAGIGQQPLSSRSSAPQWSCRLRQRVSYSQSAY